MTRRDHALLIADGFLLTMGTTAAGLGLSYGLLALRRVVGSVALQAGSGLLMLGAGIAGVVITWILHGRRINVATVIGGFAGSAAGALMIPLAAGISFLLGLPLRLFTQSEFAGPLALLALMLIAVVTLIAWLLVDAARDMAPGLRVHFRLDLARIAAAVVFAVLVGVSVYLVVAQPGPEQGEAPIWAIAAGLVAAGTLAGADLANLLWDRRTHSEPPYVTG